MHGGSATHQKGGESATRQNARRVYDRHWPRVVLIGLIALSAVFSMGFGDDTKSGAGESVQERSWAPQREAMIREQLEARGIRDPKVLQAMATVERHRFVPEPVIPWAYQDMPLPIGEGQTISQPYIVAFMTEMLDLGADDRVLEIGTGSGYQAAILAKIVKEVYSIEIVPELAEQARKRLHALGYTNVKVKHGDGYLGWPEHQPFDAIIVTAAPETVPQALIDQLKAPAGRMIVPVGTFDQELLLIRKTNEGLIERRSLPVRFVPMVKNDKE